MNRAKEIVRLHGEIGEALRLTVDKAIRIGELLTEQKAELGHGKFGPWLEQHVGFSRATVTNYMALYRDRDKFKLLRISKLTEGYELLYRPPQPRPKPKPDDDPAGDPPKTREVQLTLTTKQLNDYINVMEKLSKVFHGKTTGSIVLTALNAMLKDAEVTNAA